MILFSYKCEKYIYHCYQQNYLVLKLQDLFINFCGKGAYTVLVKSDALILSFLEKVFNVYIELPRPVAVFLFGTKILENYFWLK